MGGRVDGNLAVSRAFGDFPFKTNESIPAREQKVSAEPDVMIIDREELDSYLVFACDGIWDAIPEPHECVQIMNELLVCDLFGSFHV